MTRMRLRELAPRLLLVIAAGWLFYQLEPAFHVHGAEVEDPLDVSPAAVGATLSYLAGFATIVLLAGFISDDRRRGYAPVYLSHPVSPLGFYSRRWGLSVALALAAAVVFFLLGQLVAWGEIRGGWSGLSLALMSAVVYGGIMAFLSAVLPRGDAWVAFLLFLPTLVPQVTAQLQQAMPAGGSRLLTFVLPPQAAFQSVYEWILTGTPAPGALAYALGYGLAWLLVGGLVVQVREWE